MRKAHGKIAGIDPFGGEGRHAAIIVGGGLIP
jgi:hypothetical protein